jgi:flavin reductase (DIM6/NTAB) family NADH-FMN oxidoreductase RutF
MSEEAKAMLPLTRRDRERTDDEDIADALEEMPYGLYIIGSRDADGQHLNGMMADWTMQVSFKPRLVAVSIENSARTLRNVRASRVFSVNVLPSDGIELARNFAQPYEGSKIEGRSEEAAAQVHNKLEHVDYALGQTGCPVLQEALAWFECEVEEIVPVGDHHLVVGRVIDGAVVRDGEPLTQKMLGWNYGG